MSETIVQRSGDAERRKNANKVLSEVGHLRGEYKTKRLKLDELEATLSNEIDRQERCSKSLLQLQEKLSSIQEIIDSDYLPEGAQPVARIQKRDSILIQVGQLEVALIAQKQSTQLAFDIVNQEEKKLFEIDRDLNRYVDKLEDAETSLQLQMELDKERSNRLAKLEAKRALKWESEQVKAIDARAKQIQDLKVLADKQIQSTRMLHATAATKVNNSLMKTKQLSEAVKANNDSKLADRTEAVLELKTNVNAVSAAVATQADAHNRRLKAAEKQFNEEKDSLLAKGINPYVSFRKRDLEAADVKKEQHMIHAVEENKVHLAERLIREEDVTRVEQSKIRKAKAYEKKHREEQGRHVIEDRNQDYITSITTENKEVLDPTGRLGRVDPSQVVDIHDHSFGLGKSSRISSSAMRRITEKVRQELNVDKDDLGEYQRLVQALIPADDKRNASHPPRPASSSSSTTTTAAENKDGSLNKQERDLRIATEKKLQQLQSYANIKGPVPGSDTAALTININNNDTEGKELMNIVEEEYGQLDTLDSIQDSLPPKYIPVKQSQFEKDSFEKAKLRLKNRLEEGVAQIAGGRVFTGDSFASTPSEIIFKDFIIGNKYKRTFTLTNVSYTFNSFKIIDLSYDVIDFFTITYDKPGRMSAGVSCVIEIEFAPAINKDIDTNLKLLTQTGPVYIPLKCLIKRCAPRIPSTVVDFGTVIRGQKISQRITITNTEAIGSNYTIAEYNSSSTTDGIASTPPPTDTFSTNSDSRRGSGAIEAAVAVADSAAAPSIFEECTVADLGTVAATNEGELHARVRRVLNNVLQRKLRDDPTPLSIKTGDGVVRGYDSSTVTITCAPLSLGSYEQTFICTFDSVNDDDGTTDSDGCLVTRVQYITAKVMVEDIPIYAVNTDIDLRAVLHDRIYRKRFELRNRSKTAYRVNINVPAPYNRFIEVSPDMLFVQGLSSQFINVKVMPLPQMLAKLVHFCVQYDEYINAAMVAVPVEINVVNQELPIYFVVKGIICQSKLHLSCTTLDYRTVYVNQTSSLTIRVKNTSMLAQRIAFVKLKKEMSVSPNDGFATLLPNESVDFDVAFCPTSAIEYSYDLTIVSSFNDTYSIKVLGQGIHAPVTFSDTVIHMRSTCPGERVLESVSVTNNSNRTQCFEVMSPDSRYTWLKISPNVLELAAGKAGRIEIEYTPPDNVSQLDPIEWHQSVSNDAASTSSTTSITSPFDEWCTHSGWVWATGIYGKLQWVKHSDTQISEDVANAEEATVAVNVPEKEWGIIGDYRLPICFKSKDRNSNTHTATTTGNMSLSFPMFICIQTVCTLPQLVSDCKLLDFGQMAVGTRMLKTFKVGNMTLNRLYLLADGISATGPFSLLAPVKSIASNEYRALVVECLPVRPGLNVEILEIFTPSDIGGHRARITLKCQGVKPTIELKGLISPPIGFGGIGSGLLDFGNVVGTDSSKLKFSIHNTSSFAVTATINRTISAGLIPSRQYQLIEKNLNGQPVFLYSPEVVKILPQQSQEITVIFQPDKGRFQPYREDLNIVVGQTDEVIKVGLFGRSWLRQICVTPSDPTDEPFHKNVLQSSVVSEDSLLLCSNVETRSLVKENMDIFGSKLCPSPAITLDYPDPYADGVDAKTYVEASAAATLAAGKGATATSSSVGGRLQKRSINISSMKINDVTRVGAAAGGSNGTYEIVLSQAAKDCKLWSISSDKGAIAIGSSTSVDISCTLPKPRGIGGLAVGSWKVFDAVVVIKGGWMPAGELDEYKIPIVLRCFLCL